MNIYQKYIEMIDSMRAPGESPVLVAIFTPKGTVYTHNGILTDSMEIENYVNKALLPYAFVNGVFCSGVHHGSFATNRNYCKVTELENKGEEDYSFDYDLLNYVHAFMVASNEYRVGKNLVTMITYSNDCGTCIITEYKDEKDFTFQTKDEMEWYEESCK